MGAVLQRGVLVHELIVQNSRTGVGGSREYTGILTVDGECDVHECGGVEERIRKDVEYVHRRPVKMHCHCRGGERRRVRCVVPGLLVDLAEV